MPPTDQTAKSKRVRVRATAMGYYDHILRREGDVFDIASDTPAHFSKYWMERVPLNTPKAQTGSNEALKREGAAGAPKTSADDDSNPLGAE